METRQVHGTQIKLENEYIRSTKGQSKCWVANLLGTPRRSILRVSARLFPSAKERSSSRTADGRCRRITMGGLELAGLEVELAEDDLPGINDIYLPVLAGPEYIFDRAMRSAYISQSAR